MQVLFGEVNDVCDLAQMLMLLIFYLDQIFCDLACFLLLANWCYAFCLKLVQIHSKAFKETNLSSLLMTGWLN